MPMAGCFGGDDSSDAPDEELTDWNVHFAATAADLPTCDEDTNGRLYYVEENNHFRVCKTFGWELIAIHGSDGADGQDGVDGTDGAPGADGADGADGVSILITTSSSTSCANGGNTFNIGPDSNSNGFLETSEVVMNVDVCNGAQGPAGNDGADGQEGAPGADGQDGQDGAQGPQGPAGPPGADGQDGQDGAQGPQGPAGPPGADGNVTLAVATTLSPGGSLCWGDGGVQLDFGVDDNNNGVLDSSEIDDTTYICNGGDGADGDSAYQIWLNNGNTGSEQDFLDSLEGDQGPQGPAGNDGATALIATSTEPAGTNCANGGVKIEAGVDDNGNGQLDSNEVDSTQYICDGGSSVTTMLTSYSTPPTSMGCDVGGRVISHGLDNGDGGGTAVNGQLESGEVDYSTTYCTKSILLRLDINPGSGSGMVSTITSPSEDAHPTVFNNELYFQGYSTTYGYELWKYDGVNAPSMVADTRSGSSNGYSKHLTVFNNELYFVALDSFDGTTLWKTDGTTTGTSMVADINPGAFGANMNYLTVFNNELFFSADDGTHGEELWKYDGVNAPIMVADLVPGSAGGLPGHFTIFNNELYFAAQDGIHGLELWKTDGTTTGTIMVADINPSAGSSHPFSLTVFNNELYFRADDGTHGFELWKYDGVNAPSMVADIRYGSNGCDPADLIVFNDELYFYARGDYLGFNANAYGYELWKYDGVNTPSLVADINPSGSSSVWPHYLTVFNNELYFKADDGTNGSELWNYDGINPPTMMANINSGSGSSSPDYLTVFNNGLYFSADDGINGIELWKYAHQTSITYS